MANTPVKIIDFIVVATFFLIALWFVIEGFAK